MAQCVLTATMGNQSRCRWLWLKSAAVFAHRVSGAVAAMTASLGGLDALVFTAGIGENSAAARAAICGRLGFIGIELDSERNASARPDAEIGADGAAARVVVLRAREDVVAARAARARLVAAY